MEKVLLYFALSLCVAATLLYLWRAFDRSSVWGWMSILLPPVALIYYAVYWERSKKLACFHIVAFSVMLLSTVMAVRAHPFAFEVPVLSNLRTLFAPASYGEPLLLDEQRFPSKWDLKQFETWSEGKFGGILSGQRMIVENVSLIGGVIRFTEGSSFFSERQVSIVLGKHDVFSSQTTAQLEGELKKGELKRAKRWHLLVTPDELDAPSIYLSTKGVRDALPNIDIVKSGYWMDLTLETGAPNLLSGHIRLLLPGAEDNFLTGYFDGYTNELRYKDGEIDRSVHSNETLQHVVSTHLQKRLGHKLASINGFSNTTYDLNGTTPVGRSDVHFTLHTGVDSRERTESIDLLYSQDGWGVVEQSTRELFAAVKQMKQNPPAAGIIKEPLPVIVSVDESESLLGKRVSVTLKGGKEREGVLQQITPFVLVLRNQLGTGHVDVSIGKREVDSVRSIERVANRI